MAFAREVLDLSGIVPAVGTSGRFCYLARYGHLERGEPMTPCHGRLIKAHLIPRQVMKRYGGKPSDPRSWVWCCGGIMGQSGHHGAFDSSRRLRLARAAIPLRTEELAADLGIEWWLDREFGLREEMPHGRRSA